MMRMQQLIKLSKTTLSACLVAGVLSAGMAQAGVSQAPLNLVEGVSPNVILTLDESGSMSWGYIPDTTAQSYKDLIGSYNNKRYHANNTNPLAYNPHLVYEIPPAFELNGDSKELATSFSSAPANGFGVQHSTNNPRVNLATQYRPIYEHRIPLAAPNYANHPNDSNGGWTNTSNGRRQNTAAYYYEFDGTLVYSKGILCEEVKDNKYAGGENCYRYRKVDQTSAYDKDGERLRHPDGTLVDGRQNFAIWYSFYRSRALATLSAASIAFYDLSSNIRFTWQNLDTCKSFTGTTSGSGSCFANSLKPFNAKHRGEFYSWLRNVYFNKGTPLPAAMKRAGEYLKTDTPWKMNPQGGDIGKKGSENTKENTLACRPSYHVLMTDGMWNATTTNPGSFRSDDTTFATPSSAKYPAMSYNNVKPFYDSTTNTLADFAMHYWATDLRTDLDNKVPTFVPFKHDSMADEYWDPRNNPAGWQHMTNFVMGLGLTTSLNNADIPWAGSTHAGAGYKALVDGTATWPPAASGSANNVYDLWHAAINSRGDFYSVDSPADMVKAFKDILSRIAERQSTATLPAIASSVEEADPNDSESVAKLASYFYRSSFDSKDWSGDLEKIKSYISYEDNKRTEVTETVWKASKELPLHGARKIYMASSTASNKLKEFNTTNADTALKNALNKKPDEGTSDGNWEKRLNFIRGARSEEGGLFRERSSVLGDFLGSQPVYVAGARYLEGFANKIEGNTKYSEFVEQQKSRRAQIYIGGNAGMLHAFDAATGVEKFAFVPTAVFPHLNRLTDPRYAETHRFFVDGTPEVADVYDGQNWRTILVGTLRAGGQGIFALDITNPDEIKLLWELDQNSAAFIDKVKPGHSFPRPTIARLHNGRWAVVTGNGYDNGDDSGKAALYIIDAITGELTKSLEVQSPGSATHNGLSTPKLADFDGDGVADYAYAGDLHGNLWRFDLLGANAEEGREKTEGSIYGDKVGDTTGFKVSYGAEPMFTAESSNKRAQTIMAPPSLVRHPNRQSYLIVFGTGKYYEEGDAGGDLSTAQSIYAIWDEKTKAQTTSALSISRDDLLEQSFIENVVGKNEVAGVNREARTLSDNEMDWESKKGWVLDLEVDESALTGEMLINDMRVVGTTLLFSTLVPNDDPCAHGAGNWLYAINPFTGGRTVRHVFDTRNADPDHSVQVVSGIKFGGPGGVPLHSTPGGLEVYPGEGVNIAEMTGRQTWRMVPDP
ncbi:PilC/PilY family type IV pilus protein [Thiopseudomonas sp. CY1220]|uniref:PilC/PilY family type IV pilus protein n=2 Tax=Thiopseudomonas acetoxidans TaxID=3041622 RepID=A0ABT7SML8_9GAMM|nr:PilC/PilY family type IV pilus protein [Thiopseudomonas sp. CY1220]